MGTPTIARLLDSTDRKAVPGLRHVERWKGPDRATAASRRDAQRGSRPPTGVGAVVREGVTKLAPGGTMHPARTLSTLPAPQPRHTGGAGDSGPTSAGPDFPGDPPYRCRGARAVPR